MKDNLLEIVTREELAKPAEFLSAIDGMDEVDIADVFENLDTTRAVRFFRLLPKSIAGEVFAYIVKEKKQEIIQTISDAEQAALINDLFADDAADLIEEMPANVVTKLLKNANAETRQNINSLLKYPEDSAGSIMTMEYVRLKEDQQVSDVFDIIREHGVDKETIYTCYVVDNKKTLIGVVSVKDLLLASPKAKIKDIMTENPHRAHTIDPQGEVAEMFRKYGYLSLPVTDSEEKLIGIVTVDDVLQVIEEEHTEDISKMAAVKPSDAPYMKTSVIRHSRNRIVWLFFLMVSAMLTGGVLSIFEDRLLAIPILIAFIPLLMDTAGNAGAQTSALVIRGMALGEIKNRDLFKVWWKEIRVASICGILLGAVNLARILLFDGLIIKGNVSGQLALVSLVVTMTLCCTVIIAKSVGCLLPVFAKKCKMDPAVMSAPLITTIADVLALLVYFGFAAIFLQQWL